MAEGVSDGDSVTVALWEIEAGSLLVADGELLVTSEGDVLEPTLLESVDDED